MVATLERSWNGRWSGFGWWRFRLVLEVVKRPPAQIGFAVLPRRWVVERTFAGLSFHRRLSKEYERLTPSSEAFIQIAMMRLMLRRLRPN